MTLNELAISQNAVIIKVYDKRLINMGVVSGFNVFKVRDAPLKGSSIYKVKDTLLAIHNNRAKRVIVELL